MLGLEAEDGKSGFDSHSKQKHKKPIKVDINITVVPKSKKVSVSSWFSIKGIQHHLHITLHINYTYKLVKV